MSKIMVQLECDTAWVSRFLAIYELFVNGGKDLTDNLIIKRDLAHAIDYLSFLSDGSAIECDFDGDDKIIAQFNSIGGRKPSP